MIKRLGCCILLYLMLLGGLLSSAASVRADDTRELSLTTAFLYNFAKYTEWPTDQERSFAFCVEEEAEVQPFMSKLTARTLRNRKIEVLIITTTDQLSACDVAYFDSASRLSEHVINADLPMLLVGRDIEDADITLFKSDDTLQFKIRLRRVEAKGFKFRSQLLNIAAETR